MKKPLTNDFGVPIARDTARLSLRACGWFDAATQSKKWRHDAWKPMSFTLRQAWAFHTGVPQ
jgi:hypothetical protein